MDARAGAIEQLTKLWRDMSLVQRGSLVGGGLGVLLLLGWLAYGLQSDTYRTLVASHDASVQAEVVDALTQAGVPYRVRGGSRVEVPQQRFDESRMALARQGLPQQGGLGYELFDNAGFGMTAFTQQVNLQRAMENELARSIRTLEAVEAARVHLVMPREALFTEARQAPSASVVLHLRPGAVPTDRQVESIRFLVGSAVEGLDPRAVTVVDNRGTMLARPSAAVGSGGEAADELRGIQRQLEAELSGRVNALLEPLVGAGQVTTQVSVELDTSQVVETLQEYDPEQLAVRSEQRTDEMTRTRGEGPGAGAGVRANLDGLAGGNGAGGAETTRSSEILNYEVNLRVRELRRTGYRVDGMSVAVVLNRRPSAEGTSGTRSEEELERLASLVRNAVGARAERGDRVMVIEEAYTVAVEEAYSAPRLWERPDLIWSATRALLLVALLGGAILLFRNGLRATGASGTPRPEGLKGASAADGSDAGLREATRPGSGVTVRAPDALPDLFHQQSLDIQLPGGPSPHEALRQQVSALGATNFERTAEIVSMWIQSDDSRERRI
jgi:flagellar M-ring protein FliF